MSEYRDTGILRVASTKSSTINSYEINVYTLNFFFEIMSHKSGIYPGNSVILARYYGLRLYI